MLESYSEVQFGLLCAQWVAIIHTSFKINLFELYTGSQNRLDITHCRGLRLKRKGKKKRLGSQQGPRVGFMWCWMQFSSLLLLKGGWSSFFLLHFLPHRHMPLMLALQQLQHLSFTHFKSGSVCPANHIRKQSQQKSEWSAGVTSWVSFLGHLLWSDEHHTQCNARKGAGGPAGSRRVPGEAGVVSQRAGNTKLPGWLSFLPPQIFLDFAIQSTLLNACNSCVRALPAF